jgi:hypothetical protein
MTVALNALAELGYAKEASEIEQKWRMLLNIGGYKQNADYRRCFDAKLLKSVAHDAVIAYKAIGCVSATSQRGHALIYDLLNEGWVTFWSDPSGYAAWERGKVKALFRQSE